MKLSRAAFLLAATGALLALQTSCLSGKKVVSTFPIGYKVQVGKLFYQVIDAQWITDLRGAKEPPKNRVLQVRLTVTNAGAVEASLPYLRLIDGAGNEIVEVSEIEGNTQWLGMLRRMQPALTEEGLVYFDVPLGAYKLEVVDNTNAENEMVAYIDIPASLAPPTQVPITKGN
jgi:hypothetical protein